MSALLIDGTLTGGGAGTFATIDPATGQPLGYAPDADTADMDRAYSRISRSDSSSRASSRSTTL